MDRPFVQAKFFENQELSNSTNIVATRSRNTLVGLAIGDALSWPALFHRSYQYPFWTRRLRREMDVASEEANIVSLQMPFSLNQPPDGFAVGPTDDSEWAAFLMRSLLGKEESAFANASADAWIELAAGEPAVRGSVGTQAALHNLRRGIQPPQSGHDNPHYFDSSATLRVVPLAVYFPGDPIDAAKAAKTEAHISNSTDGVWAAQATAAGLSVALGGGSVVETITAARKQLPAGSLVARTVEKALSAADAATSMISLCFALSNDVVNREYNYGNAASEVLAVALALVQFTDGDIEWGILGANSVAKVADGAAPLTGAFCGSLTDSSELAEVAYFPTVATGDPLRTLPGVCVPSTMGVDYIELVKEWVEFCSTRRSSSNTNKS